MIVRSDANRPSDFRSFPPRLKPTTLDYVIIHTLRLHTTLSSHITTCRHHGRPEATCPIKCDPSYVCLLVIVLHAQHSRYLQQCIAALRPRRCDRLPSPLLHDTPLRNPCSQSVINVHPSIGRYCAKATNSPPTTSASTPNDEHATAFKTTSL